MNTIFYLDNCRGFQKQFLELGDVNFFVGENSSGKSSIINIIGLLSNPKFWYTYEFNDEGIDLGEFEDILSCKHDSSIFSIGFYTKNFNKRKNDYMHFIKFKNDDGNVAISEQHILENKVLLSIKHNQKTAHYKISNIENCLECKDSFAKCIETIESINFSDAKLVSGKNRDYEVMSYLGIIIGKEKSIKENFDNLIPLSYLQTRGISLVAPIRAKPKNIYTGNKIAYDVEGEYAPYIIKGIFAEKKKRKISKETQEQISFLFEYGKESGLYDDIIVEKFNKKSNSPFEIDIIRESGKYKINNVGYGVSQVLPVITSALGVSSGAWVSIQQPEVHLHPKAQAAFGELLFYASNNLKQKFIIETHSDYVIDRFRMKLRDSKINQNAFVFYFENIDGHNKIYKIKINKDGSYPQDQPKGFREFFIDETMDLMGI